MFQFYTLRNLFAFILVPLLLATVNWFKFCPYFDLIRSKTTKYYSSKFLMGFIESINKADCLI